MKTLALSLDDELDETLEAISTRQGRTKADLVTDLVRKYVAAEQLRKELQDPALIALYQQLAAEDVQRAEEGMADYQQSLREADRS